MRPLVVIVLALAVLAAACSADGTENADGVESADDVESNDTVGQNEPSGEGSEVAKAAEPTGDETLALDRGPNAPEADSDVPSEAPAEPIGRPGYSRYVYTQAGDAVIPALVEGPRGAQVRCQSVELPCSYRDLVELAGSGDDIPAELDLTREELAALLAELTSLQSTLSSLTDPADACAAGYRPDRNQTPNMGSHFTNLGLIDARFDPAEPEILLFARVDGAEPDGALGTCDGDEWIGDDVEIVGAAYFMPHAFTGPDHFDGFSGQLDNWHIHYNLCRLDGNDVTVDPADCGLGTPNGPPGKPRGDASEGWMIHAWAGDGFDNQLGVFSMWNPTIWPVAGPEAVAERGSVSGATDDTHIVRDFTLPDITLSGPGPLSFFNADGEAHTITAGTPTDQQPTFDSGVVTGRESAEIEIGETGTFSYFCQIHPTMQATITVG